MVMVIAAAVVATTVALHSASRFDGTGYHARGFGIMTQLPQSAPIGRSMWKLVVGMLIRVTVSVTILFAAYYLVPTKGSGEDSDLPWLILELVIFGVVVAIQIPAIIKAKYPNLRAIEALAVTVPLFLLIFSRIYLSNSLTDPAVFTHPLDNTAALYFTVTVFATVGFGDIVAQTNGMRLLVTLQMLLDLAVLGLVIKLLTSAAQRGVQRRHELRGDTDGTDPPSDPIQPSQ
jgi:voltage-gated potassium channel